MKPYVFTVILILSFFVNNAYAIDYYWQTNWGTGLGTFDTPFDACEASLDKTVLENSTVASITNRSMRLITPSNPYPYPFYYICNGTFNFIDPDRYPWTTHAIGAAYPYQINYYTTAPQKYPCKKRGNPLEGNPCDPATGNKYQTETDYSLINGTLKVERYYTSQNNLGDGYGLLGPRWRHNYTRKIDGYGTPDYNRYRGAKSPLYSSPSEACTNGWNTLKNVVYRGQVSDGVPNYLNGVCEIHRDGNIVAILPVHNDYTGRIDVGTTVSIRAFSRPNGNIIYFRSQNGQWHPIYSTQSNLVLNDSEWELSLPNGNTEIYDSDGNLLTINTKDGMSTNFTYEDGRLAVETDNFGDTLTYHYNDSGRLIRITTPEGDIGYSYGGTGNRLIAVTYTDGSTRQYHYENTSFPYNLTGITDENSQRYANWAYDAYGRVILSEHADGAEQVEFVYNSDGTTTVTDAAGAERIYHFTVQQGQLKVDHIEGDRCTTCSGGDTQAYSYDTNGFIVSKTDWNGSVTTYTRDLQGRELSRTEAAGTPDARTVTTTWDTSLNKPLVITEPDRITEYTYDANGRKLSTNRRPHP
ncbi:MAG: DUF6531 domain-containing protein [Candidatus Thiodiazotropha endolucinida]